MTKHRSHSAALKRQVAEEFIAGETLHAPYRIGKLITKVFASRESLLAALVGDFMVFKMRGAERRAAFAASIGATNSDLTEEVIADWWLDKSFDYKPSHMVRYEYGRAHLEAAFAAYRVEVANRPSLEWDDNDADRSPEQGLHDIAEETKHRIIAHYKLGIVTAKTTPRKAPRVYGCNPLTRNASSDIGPPHYRRGHVSRRST